MVLSFLLLHFHFDVILANFSGLYFGRSMLVVLGIANETHMQQPYHPSSLHSADSSSSVRGATST